jgi:hypothetical protein
MCMDPIERVCAHSEMTESDRKGGLMGTRVQESVGISTVAWRRPGKLGVGTGTHASANADAFAKRRAHLSRKRGGF